MNSDIIPQGPRELVTGPANIANALEINAVTDIAITALLFQFPKTPANAAKVTAGTIKAQSKLNYVKSVTISTGTAEVVFLPA